MTDQPNALSLDLCQWLRDTGFPQDRWPQMVWVAYNLIGPRGSDPDGGFWNCEYAENDRRLTSDREIGEWCAVPPLLSADPEHLEYGVLGWLETMGWYWHRRQMNGLAYWESWKVKDKIEWQVVQRVRAVDPIALCRAIRERMRAVVAAS